MTEPLIDTPNIPADTVAEIVPSRPAPMSCSGSAATIDHGRGSPADITVRMEKTRPSR
jgi:hypothetical protein